MRSKQLSLAVVASVIAGSGFCQLAKTQAAVTTFFGEDLQTGAFSTSFLHPNADAARNQFESNLSTIITQDFEAVPVGTASPIAVQFGSTNATITGSTAVISNTAQSGAFATSGTHYVFTTTDLDLTFSSPQAAFGFYGTDIGDSGATSLILTLNNSTQETVSVPANFTSAANGSVLYEGILAPAGEAFTGVSFANNSNGADFFGFDDFTIATPAQVTLPETSSMPLCLVIAGSGLLLARRRKPAV